MHVRTKARIIAFLFIILCLAPVIAAATTTDSTPDQSAAELRATATDVTFISTQGGSVHVYDHAGKVVAIHTPTKQEIWRNDDYRRYMDIDPLGSDRLLFVAGERDANGDGFHRVAVVVNWRTGEELTKFRVPGGTHDIDYLGDGQYAIAALRDQEALIYNATSETTTWTFDFRNHYPPYPQAGGEGGDWTHLNDIDSVNNGSAFLLSPRNFDRVILVDKETKEVRWTLGEENNYDIINEQHNPVLLTDSPPTVLVADSENDRIVEYRRAGGDWQLVWEYSGQLNWPRDADRFPNGNTLVTDSSGDRVLEVTPSREIVWEYDIERGPYDAERLQYGDEPAGPSMVKFSDSFTSPRHSTSTPGAIGVLTARLDATLDTIYQLVGGWILPVGAGRSVFPFALLATLGLVGWIGTEVATHLPVEKLAGHLRNGSEKKVLSLGAGGLALVSGAGVLALVLESGGLTGIYVAVGLSLVNIGLEAGDWQQRFIESRPLSRVLDTVAVAATLTSIIAGAILLLRQIGSPTHVALYGAAAVLLIVSATLPWRH